MPILIVHPGTGTIIDADEALVVNWLGFPDDDDDDIVSYAEAHGKRITVTEAQS